MSIDLRTGKPHPRWTNTLSERNMTEAWHSDRRSQKESPRKAFASAFSLDSPPVPFLVENGSSLTMEQLEYHHEFPPSPSSMVGGFEQYSLSTHSYANLDSQASDSPTSQSFDSPFTEYVKFLAGELFNLGLYLRRSINSLPPHCPSCACLSNSSTRASLEFLVNQIQGTLNRLQKLPEHARDSQCPVYQTIRFNSILW